MRRSFEGDFEADVGSTEGSHSIVDDSFSDVVPGPMDEEQMASIGSAADSDDVLEATELHVESADLIRHSLAIFTHANHPFEHGHDDGDTVDSDAVPPSFSIPQIAFTGGIAGMSYSISTPLNGGD